MTPSQALGAALTALSVLGALFGGLLWLWRVASKVVLAESALAELPRLKASGEFMHGKIIGLEQSLALIRQDQEHQRENVEAMETRLEKRIDELGEAVVSLRNDVLEAIHEKRSDAATEMRAVQESVNDLRKLLVNRP